MHGAQKPILQPLALKPSAGLPAASPCLQGPCGGLCSVRCAFFQGTSLGKVRFRLHFKFGRAGWSVCSWLCPCLVSLCRHGMTGACLCMLAAAVINTSVFAVSSITGVHSIMGQRHQCKHSGDHDRHNVMHLGHGGDLGYI